MAALTLFSFETGRISFASTRSPADNLEPLPLPLRVRIDWREGQYRLPRQVGYGDFQLEKAALIHPLTRTVLTSISMSY
jgi:hypothetical protein